MRELDNTAKQALLAPFQAAEVRVRTKPYVAAYVTARVVSTRLDEALPFQWSFRLGEQWTDAAGVLNQTGALLLHQADGPTLEYWDRGSAVKDSAGQPKQSKAAVSDCLKRCAVHLGVGRYLYELQGVSERGIPKASVEKALAAVGYSGPWDERHYGTIGGIREADAEDDEASVATTPSRRISDDQRRSIVDAVRRGGGDPAKPSFLNWLSKNTANRAATLEDVLAEDAEEVLRRLAEISSKK